MSSQTALYKILYHNDTLYQFMEPGHSADFVKKKAKPESAAPIAEDVKPIEPKVPIPLLDKPILVSPETPAVEKFPDLNHKILILVDDPKKKDIPASELLFLDNILKAVKSSANDADIINFSLLPQTDARNLLSEKRINHFITFGVPLIKLNLDLLLIPYTPKLVEGIWFLLTDPLVVIEAERDLKRKLWQALQKMFENV